MDKDLMKNNDLGKILKNYLKQENMTINTLSKESKIKLETIKKILENSYHFPFYLNQILLLFLLKFHSPLLKNQFY